MDSCCLSILSTYPPSCSSGSLRGLGRSMLRRHNETASSLPRRARLEREWNTWLSRHIGQTNTSVRDLLVEQGDECRPVQHPFTSPAAQSVHDSHRTQRRAALNQVGTTTARSPQRKVAGGEYPSASSGSPASWVLHYYRAAGSAMKRTVYSIFPSRVFSPFCLCYSYLYSSRRVYYPGSAQVLVLRAACGGVNALRHPTCSD